MSEKVLMDSSGPLYFRNRQEWRRWLEDNRDRENEAWLVTYRKHAGKPGISHDEAVDEAICFGWIDTKMRKIDEERFTQKYVPRKPNSTWSLINKNRALKMIEQGRMTKAGLERINDAKRRGVWDSAYSLKTEVRLPDDLKRALGKKKIAWGNFERLEKGYKNFYIIWVNGAKREETRRRRIAEVVERIAENKKPGIS